LKFTVVAFNLAMYIGRNVDAAKSIWKYSVWMYDGSSFVLHYVYCSCY